MTKRRSNNVFINILIFIHSQFHYISCFFAKAKILCPIREKMPIKNKLHTDHFSSENKMLSSVMAEYMPTTESSLVKYLVTTCKAIHCRFIQYVKDINSALEHKRYS